MTDCPDTNTLAALVESTLATSEERALHEHVDSCVSCRQLLAALAQQMVPGERDEAGATVGHYRLERLLGRGGMGVVWRAVDTRLGRTVALKFIADRLDGDRQASARFLREARATSALDHPNVAAVFELGQADGRHYLAMALLDGESLKQRLDRGPLPLAEATRTLTELAAGLGAAHRSGVVHRDVKPGNIMLTSTGVKIVDFGLAKLERESAETLTQEGAAMGTLAYMAPEQLRGESVDARADVWSLGVVGYELLAGRRPFMASTMTALLETMQSDPSPLRDVPADLETVLRKCLDPDPLRRYPTAEAVERELLRIADHLPIEARPPSLGYRAGKLIRRHRVRTAVLAMLLLGALGGGAWRIVERRRAAAREREAQALGQRVQKMRSLMREAHLMPPHDLRSERENVRAEMREVEAAMQRLGGSLDGPGHFGLGTGWLVLDEWKPALDELESAWAAGERGPDEAYSLGVALAVQYRQKMRELSGSPQQVAAGREQLKTRYATRAIALLRAAGGAQDISPAYVEALIPYVERRLDDSLRLAEKAFSEAPRYYESAALAATSASGRARGKLAGGDVKGANEDFERARHLFEKALEIARSDDWLYRQKADQLLEQVDIVGSEDRDPTSLLHEVIDAARMSQRLRPDAADALQLEAEAWARLGERLKDTGGNPAEAFAQAVTLADRGAAADPRSAPARSAVADVYGLRGEWESALGHDPSNSYRRSAEASRAALALAPNDTDFPRNLVITLNAFGKWQEAHGVDGRATLAEALTVARSVVAHGSSVVSAQGPLTEAAQLSAQAALAHGDDPAGLADEAEGDARARVAAEGSEGADLLAATLLLRAELRVREGADPRPVWSEAETEVERAVKSAPQSAYEAAFAARVFLAEAERATNPRRASATARAAMYADRALALDPSSIDAQVARARLAILNGDRARARATLEAVLSRDATLVEARGLVKSLR